jgi:hypothetical protein
MRSTGDCVCADFPEPSTVHAKALSPADRSDPVLGPSDLVRGEAVSGVGVHDLGRRFDSSGQKRMEPCVALETLARSPSIEGLSRLGPEHSSIVIATGSSNQSTRASSPRSSIT